MPYCAFCISSISLLKPFFSNPLETEAQPPIDDDSFGVKGRRGKVVFLTLFLELSN